MAIVDTAPHQLAMDSNTNDTHGKSKKNFLKT